MKLIVDCQRCIDDARTLYDFMSLAMEQIVSNAPDYVDLNYRVNSNIKILSFIEDVKIGLYNSMIVDKFTFSEARGVLNNLISEIDFLVGNDAKCSALVLYAILRAIDSKYLFDSNYIDELGPLDSDNTHRFRLYRYIPNTLIDPFINFTGKQRTNGSDISRSFENFIFIDRQFWSKGKAVPVGVMVDDPWSIGSPDSMPRPVRIGVSLFCSEKNFDFVSDVSGQLTVDYSCQKQERFCNIVEKIINKAISNECDFLVFPEYHSSQAVLEQIKICLKHAYNEGDKTPILTFAGSQWTADNTNQMTIFEKTGDPLCFYNKYSPFIGVVDTSELRNKSGEPWRTEKLNVTEGLNNRDKNLVFLGINNFGTILPAICKDSYSDDYTQVLAQELHPLFIIISSWSKSRNSFQAPLNNMCCRYFASSVLANACSAIDKNRKDAGCCNTVCMPNTVPIEDNKPIERPRIGCNCCDSGCLYVAEYKFGYHVDNNTKDGKFIEPSLEVYCKVVDK